MRESVIKRLTLQSNLLSYFRAKKIMKGIRSFLICLFIYVLVTISMLSTLKSNEEGLIYFGKYSYSILESGSMVPKYPKGTLCITKKQESYVIGDVVTVILEDGSYRTHKIIEPVIEEGKVVGFITQGTAPGISRDSPIRIENIIGKVIFKSLLLGILMTITKLIPVNIYIFTIVSLFSLCTILLILKLIIRRREAKKILKLN